MVFRCLFFPSLKDQNQWTSIPAFFFSTHEPFPIDSSL
ncbi:hypothetical protein B4123_1279 [Bacillus paralicheniformis]|nr:hypothetical protein B4123_1279 [Bacillus paralicheniformis]TWJ57606.1 hypothetical protein CHCC5023_3836 [Bacillus paralicheniformis]